VRLTALGALHWLTALALLATLYGHTLLGLDRLVVTPLASGVFLLCLLADTSLSRLRPRALQTSSSGRALAAGLALASWVLCLSITLAHYTVEAPSVRDLGLLAIRSGLPVLLLLNTDRPGLLRRIAAVCVCCAFADLVWNLAIFEGVIAPDDVASRATQAGARIARYPGASGAILSAGEVGLIAVCALASKVNSARSVLVRLACAILIALILADFIAIDTRRYFGETLVGATVLLIPAVRRRIPLPLVAVGLAAVFLWLTFNSAELENVQRSNLMAVAWSEARQGLWLGSGLHYRASPMGHTFQSLWASGTTESGFIDFIIAYGLPATLVFVAGSLFALSTRRSSVTYAPVLLALLTADLECSDTLESFLGGTVFFLCLLYVIFDESAPSRRGVPHAASRAPSPPIGIDEVGEF
jgi:hypothetical protein